MHTIRPTDKIDSPRRRAASPRADAFCLASKAFERQARATPEAAAVTFAGRAYSYSRLNAQADALAHRLASLGVGADCLVGVALERSPRMIVSLLAVLKAGGAFLPFDPHYPSERLEFMFADGAPRWCLTHESLADSLPLTGTAATWRDREGFMIFGRGNAAPRRLAVRAAPGGSRLAYAIYTSGSTGRPKAALMTQLGLANLIAAQRDLLRLKPGRRMLQFASLAFDAAVWEIFGALTSGATLVLADGRDLLPGESLRHTIERERIDTITLPPSVLSLLGAPNLPLETVIVAGEACSGLMASEWSPGRELINAYGPTEATVCATACKCPQGEQAAPPIGAALPGVELFVFDRRLRSVAAGEAGELCVAGKGLARGYLNRPELTAEKFVRHPLVRHWDKRLYRTGDLVRRREDGQLEFLGRIDRQVKVFGVRIELDEVSAAVERHPAVRAAITLATHDQPRPRLASFAVCRDGESATADELRSWLPPKLPAAMIPASLTLVDRWPRLPNGKLDEAALLSLAERHAVGRAEEVQSPPPAGESASREAPPCTGAIREMFRQVLQTTRVGPNDDFFELGGDSLRAMELLIHLERRFARRVSLGRFLQCPTAETLAHHLAAEPRGDVSVLVPLRTRGDRPPLFLVHPAGGSVVCYRSLVRALGGDQPCYGFQSPALVADEPPPQSIQALAERYLDELSRVEAGGSCLLAGWSLGGLVAYEMAHRLVASGRPAPGLVLIDAGVLFSFQLLRQFVPVGEVPAFMWKDADRERMYARLRQHAGASLFPVGAEEAASLRAFVVFWANVEAAYHYSPPDYDGEMTLLTSAQARGKYHPLREWRQRCQRVHALELSSTHLELLEPPCVGQVAEVLKSLSSVAEVRGATSRIE